MVLLMLIFSNGTHNTRLREVGYRVNTLEQIHKMRKSAIKRQKENNETKRVP